MTTTTSILIRENKKFKTWAVLSWFCCCCCCFAIVKCMDDVFELLDEVVKKFGKKRLDAMRKTVIEEKKKFDAACVAVGQEKGGVRHGVNMINMIREGDLDLYRAMLLDSVFMFETMGMHEQVMEYRKCVYERYLEMGGSGEVLKGCLPELLAEYYDPTSSRMRGFYHLLMHDPRMGGVGV